jgi:hypothetical protein
MEYCVFEIDRENKKCKIATSRTRNQLVPMDWNTQLFKDLKEAEEADKLTDEAFIKKIDRTMLPRFYVRC